MPLFEKLVSFNPAIKDWAQYLESVRYFFQANDIEVDEQQEVILTARGPTAFAVIRSLNFPDAPDTKTFQEILHGGIVSKFADDTKIGGIVDKGYLQVEQDLDKMDQWAEEWQLEFNLDKCEVLYFGKESQGRNYTLN
eukprot:g27355.t1